ncbi:hypothetical protein BU17DRAFT_67741 [Hysterangium stoloniferum]|nr:hypothetical protein BU17DRAFT_67741 [Hysterangium stoloniferum]
MIFFVAKSITFIALGGIKHFNGAPTVPVGYSQYGKCYLLGFNDKTHIYWIPGILFQCFLFAMLIVQFIHTKRLTGMSHPRLLKIFVRDGAWAFGVTFVSLYWCTLFFWIRPQKAMEPFVTLQMQMLFRPSIDSNITAENRPDAKGRILFSRQLEAKWSRFSGVTICLIRFGYKTVSQKIPNCITLGHALSRPHLHVCGGSVLQYSFPTNHLGQLEPALITGPSDYHYRNNRVLKVIGGVCIMLRRASRNWGCGSVRYGDESKPELYDSVELGDTGSDRPAEGPINPWLTVYSTQARLDVKGLPL